MTDRSRPASLDSFGLLGLAALPVFFLSLGANAIWDANEAFYVETPRRMVLSGDYINPSFNGLPRFNKPVLSYWIVAGLYHLFGTSVAVERFGIAIGALGIAIAAYLIGRALGSRLVGTLAALAVLTAPYVVYWSRRIFIDVYLTFFMSAALACFILAERVPERRRRLLILMYVALGLGVLTKGPVALVLPGLVAAIWLAAERRLADVSRLMMAPGALIVTAIVAPWYVAVYLQHGWSHIATFFIDENIGRYTTAITPADRNVLFYLPSLVGQLFPWAPLLVIPLAAAWRRRQGVAAPEDGLRRLLWLWIVVIVVVFSFSRSKQDLYILPIVPAAAVLVADVLVRSDFGRTHRGVRTMLATVALVCLLGAGLLAWLFGSGYYALAGARLVAVLVGVSGALALVFVSTARERAAVVAIAAGFVLTNYVFVTIVLPDADRLKPVPALASAFNARASPAAAVGFYHMSLPSFVYYVNRSVADIVSPDAAALFFRRESGAWALMSEEKYQELGREVPGLCVAERRPLFVANLGDLVSRARPQDVLLVTNQCR